MSREQWTEILRDLKRDSMEAYILFEPDPSQNDLRLLEEIVQAPQAQAIAATLSLWTQHHSDFLLNRLPPLLNPSRSHLELNPTGGETRTVFPDFCRMLDATEHFAIIVDADREKEHSPLLVGSLPESFRLDIDSRNYWAYYMPESLDTILACEISEGVQLSPQLRQLFLRANGAPNLVCPYFFAVQWLFQGSLADLYRDFWEQMDSTEEFERLESFVAFSEDGCGNDTGFFPLSGELKEEYKIYEWDHELVRFVEDAPDFASWLNRILVRGW